MHAKTLRPEISLRFHLCLRSCQCCLVGGVQPFDNAPRSAHQFVLGWRWDHVIGYARCVKDIWATYKPPIVQCHAAPPPLWARLVGSACLFVCQLVGSGCLFGICEVFVSWLALLFVRVGLTFIC